MQTEGEVSMTLHDPAPGAGFDATPFVILRRTGLYIGLTVATFLIAARSARSPSFATTGCS